MVGRPRYRPGFDLGPDSSWLASGPHSAPESAVGVGQALGQLGGSDSGRMVALFARPSPAMSGGWQG